MILGAEAVRALGRARVAVFGAGGVGGYAIECLARGGVGGLDIFDPDVISVSNLNRQILALHSTVGKFKAEVASDRVRDINPGCEVRAFNVFYDDSNASEYDLSGYDYIVDAIDSVGSKLTLIERAKAAGTPIISAMGAGNKLYPEMFEVADIFETSVCPLARVMRRELKKRGIESLKVIYSKEAPISPDPTANSEAVEGAKAGKTPPGSTPFTPAGAGIIIAGEVIRDIVGRKPR